MSDFANSGFLRFNLVVIKKLKKLGFTLGVLLSGVIIGGYLFSGVQPRSFLALNNCAERCFNASELKALFASAGVQRAGGELPAVAKETEKTIVINYPKPLPTEKFHFVIIPKRDIRDVSDISSEDYPYLIDAFNVMRALIQENRLTKYKVVANGPYYQSVAYLHFHLIAN